VVTEPPAQSAPAVEEVSSRSPGPEGLGSVRECRVDFAGRAGTIVERCADLVPGSRIGYLVDDDSLGFNKMFADYGFTITLTDTAQARTRVVMDTYYTPRNVLTEAMNLLVMRRKFRKTVDAILKRARPPGRRTGQLHRHSGPGSGAAPGQRGPRDAVDRVATLGRRVRNRWGRTSRIGQ